MENGPASASEIDQFEVNAGFRLLEDYRLFLRRWNGGEGVIGPNPYVIFWNLDELMELNKAYQVAEYVPGRPSFL